MNQHDKMEERGENHELRTPLSLKTLFTKLPALNNPLVLVMYLYTCVTTNGLQFGHCSSTWIMLSTQVWVTFKKAQLVVVIEHGVN